MDKSPSTASSTPSPVAADVSKYGSPSSSAISWTRLLANINQQFAKIRPVPFLRSLNDSFPNQLCFRRELCPGLMCMREWSTDQASLWIKTSVNLNNISLFQPCTKEGVVVCQVEHEEEAHGVSEEGCGEAAEALLARGVPQLELNSLAASLGSEEQVRFTLYTGLRVSPIFLKSHSFDLSRWSFSLGSLCQLYWWILSDYQV